MIRDWTCFDNNYESNGFKHTFSAKGYGENLSNFILSRAFGKFSCTGNPNMGSAIPANAPSVDASNRVVEIEEISDEDEVINAIPTVEEPSSFEEDGNDQNPDDQIF